jgi:acetyl-CoA C-acetyltransferase
VNQRAAVGGDGQVYLVSAARTPIGRFGGAFAQTPATVLGGVAIREAMAFERV